MENELSNELGKKLLKIARQSIEKELKHEDRQEFSAEAPFPDEFSEKRGSFVSLHSKKGQLRGCIGNIEPVKPLCEGIADNAKHAAFNDRRFSPLAMEELENTKIEVSILTPSVKLEYTDAKDLVSKLRPGIDGVTIKKGYQSATFLPQVWKQLKDPEQFLRHLCMKAGLPGDEWRTDTLVVSVYQVQSFEED